MTPRYLIADAVRLDLCDERLWLNGQPTRLGGKAFALLRALMTQPQMLVTKDELIENVWNGLAVSDSVLTTAVKEVRKAMQDDARAPIFVETVHRRGYRFIKPVEQQDEDYVAALTVGLTQPDMPETIKPVGLPQTKRRWLVTAVFAALVGIMLWLYLPITGPAPLAANQSSAIHPKSIAVLPFRDLSASSDHAWFADGLTEEVISRLTRTPDLHVASRLSTGQLRQGTGTVSSMARTLGVAHVLDGAVRREDGRVRVTAELVRTSDGFQLWSQTYDRPADEVISIQEDIAFRIASAMKTVMQPAKLRAMVAAGTRSVEAYEAYLQGVVADRRSLDTGGREHAIAAAAAYERARTLDPDFAEAHWRSAQSWFGKVTRINGLLSGQGMSDAQRLAQFLVRVDRAIITSKDETESLKYRSARAAVQLELRSAHRLLVDYLKARPRDIDAWEDMAERAAYAGERSWIAHAGERIHTLSIEAGEPRSRAITVTAMALQFDDAVKRARQQIKLRPESAMVRYQAHRAFIWAGKKEEARASLRHVLASELPEETKINARLRQACADGHREDATALRKQLDVLGAPLSARWLAAQILGDKAAAKALLQPLDNPAGLPTLMQFMINPSFDTSLYPELSSTLATAGVTSPRAQPMLATCHTTV